MTQDQVLFWLMGGLFVLLGGLTKGIIGLGMPLVSVPLLSYVMPVREAVALMAMPMLLTNTYQMFNAGRMALVVTRFWTLLLALALGIALGGYFLTSLASSALGLVLGTIVLLSSLATLLRGKRGIPHQVESWANPAVGLGAGIIGGIAGLWGAPLGAYLAALDMGKEDFIASVGMSFGIGSVALVLALIGYGAFGVPQLVTSSLALLPAFAGLLIGQALRTLVSQQMFRNAVLGTLMVTGCLLIYRSLTA
jgi:uncharacterized membrane protein YfcA